MRIGEAALFIDIGYEGGFHQHRRHVRGAQDRKIGALDIRLVVKADAFQPGQYLACGVFRGSHLAALGEVQQHRRQRIVGFLRTRAADQIGRVFFVGQPACALRRSPAQRQHVHRRTLGRAVLSGVGVDRNEDVGLGRARELAAPGQRQKHVAVPGQNRLQSWRGIDLAGELTRNGQGDIFLALAGRADRARILAAVTGVDGYDQRASAGAQVLQGLPGRDRRLNDRGRRLDRRRDRNHGCSGRGRGSICGRRGSSGRNWFVDDRRRCLGSHRCCRGWTCGDCNCCGYRSGLAGCRLSRSSYRSDRWHARQRHAGRRRVRKRFDPITRPFQHQTHTVGSLLKARFERRDRRCEVEHEPGRARRGLAAAHGFNDAGRCRQLQRAAGRSVGKIDHETVRVEQRHSAKGDSTLQLQFGTGAGGAVAQQQAFDFIRLRKVPAQRQQQRKAKDDLLDGGPLCAHR